jgi:hypothetical protein
VSYQTIDLGWFPEHAKVEYRVFLSKEVPTAATGYIILPIADLGELGKVYIEYKLKVE